MSRGPDESVGAVRKSPYKPIILLFLAATMTLYAQSGPAVRRADAQAATQVGRYRLQSNPWVNLHQRLIHEARFQTARSLARRGVRDYRPSIAGMYERGFRGFEQSLETHWQAYLDGKVSREAAIRQILIETAPPKK